MGYTGVNLGVWDSVSKLFQNGPSLWDSRIRICLKLANLRVFLMVSLGFFGPKLSERFRMNQKLFTQFWGVVGFGQSYNHWHPLFQVPPKLLPSERGTHFGSKERMH